MNPNFPFPGAGKLNKYVTIRRRSDVPVGLSGVHEHHHKSVQRWARIVPVGTSTWIGSVQADATVTHYMVIRPLTGIDDSYEVLHGECIYRVRRSAPLQGTTKFTVLDLELLGQADHF